MTDATPENALAAEPSGAVVLLVDRADRLGRAGAPAQADASRVTRVAREAATLWPAWPLVLGVATGDVPAVGGTVAAGPSRYFTDVRRLRDLVAAPLPSRLVVLRPSALLLPAGVLRETLAWCAGEALDLATIAGIDPEVFYVASRRLIDVLAACGPVPGATTIPQAVSRLGERGVGLVEAGIRIGSAPAGAAAWARAAAALPTATWRNLPDEAVLDVPSPDRAATMVRRERVAFDAARLRLDTPVEIVARVPGTPPSARTLVVVSSLYQTGAHFAWLALLDALSPDDVAFAVGGSTMLHDALVERGFEVVPLPDGLAISSARDAAAFDEALRRIDPDVVHLDGVECVPWAATVRARGARMVQHVRLNALERFRPAFVHAEAIVAVSPSMQSEIVARVGTTTRVVHIPDGVRLDTYAPRDVSERAALTVHSPVDCLVVGRVEPAKGHVRVIDIFEALADRRPAHLTIVGPCGSDAAYGDEVLDRIDARPGRITWQPFSAPIAHLYRRAHVVLVGSRNEALGMVGIEAIAAGALLVAHRSIGYAHIVDPVRREGLLFDESESAADVAARVDEALAAVDAYAAAARGKAAEAFDARATARRVRALWIELGARRR